MKNALKILCSLIILLFVSSPDAISQRWKLYSGIQTTHNNLVKYDSGDPAYIPIDTTSKNYLDTLTANFWRFQDSDSTWILFSEIRQNDPPLPITASGKPELEYRQAVWIDANDNDNRYVFDRNLSAWVPESMYRNGTEPADIAATGSTGAVKYCARLWKDTDIDSVFVCQNETWIVINSTTGMVSDNLATADLTQDAGENRQYDGNSLDIEFINSDSFSILNNGVLRIFSSGAEAIFGTQGLGSNTTLSAPTGETILRFDELKLERASGTIATDNTNLKVLALDPTSEFVEQVDVSTFGDTDTHIGNANLTYDAAHSYDLNNYQGFWFDGTDTIFYIDSALIGIGTTSPLFPVHIVRPSVGGIMYAIESTAGTSYMQFYNTATGNGGAADGFTVGNNGADVILSNREDGKITFATNDLTRGVMDRLGRFGWDDTTPDYKFEISGTQGSGYFGITNTTDGDIFEIDGSGNVGIGTNTPDVKTDIYQTGISSVLRLETDQTSTFMHYHNTATGNVVGGDGSAFGLSGSDFLIRNYENSHIRFFTNDNEKVRIEAGGDVGIGTSAPEVKFHVKQSGGSIWNFGLEGDNAASAGMKFTNTNTAGKVMFVMGEDGVSTGNTPFFMQRFGSTHATRAREIEIGNETAHPIIFSTNLNERFRIAGNGQLNADEYGSGTFTGTETYLLAVEADGDVIEVDPATIGSDTHIGNANLTYDASHSYNIAANDGFWFNGTDTILYIDGGAGNVFVGRTTQANDVQLDIFSGSNADAFRLESNTTNVSFSMQNSTTGNGVGSDGSVIQASQNNLLLENFEATGQIRLETNGTEAARILPDQTILVNKTADHIGQLQVESPASNVYIAQFLGSTGQAYVMVQNTTTGTDGLSGLLLGGNGNKAEIFNREDDAFEIGTDNTPQINLTADREINTLVDMPKTDVKNGAGNDHSTTWVFDRDMIASVATNASENSDYIHIILDIPLTATDEDFGLEVFGTMPVGTIDQPERLSYISWVRMDNATVHAFSNAIVSSQTTSWYIHSTLTRPVFRLSNTASDVGSTKFHVNSFGGFQTQAPKLHSVVINNTANL